MTQATQRKKSPPRRYSAEVKSEALRLANSVGVSGVAKQLGIHSSQLYDWRSKAQLLRARGEIDEELADENSRPRRHLAEKEQEIALLGKAAGYFARVSARLSHVAGLYRHSRGVFWLDCVGCSLDNSPGQQRFNGVGVLWGDGSRQFLEQLSQIAIRLQAVWLRAAHDAVERGTGLSTLGGLADRTATPCGP